MFPYPHPKPAFPSNALKPNLYPNLNPFLTPSPPPTRSIVRAWPESSTLATTLKASGTLLLPAPPSHLFFCSSFPTSLLTLAAPQVLELLLVCTSEICKDATLPCPFFPRSLCRCPGLCPWHYSPLSTVFGCLPSPCLSLGGDPPILLHRRPIWTFLLTTFGHGIHFFPFPQWPRESGPTSPLGLVHLKAH